MADAPRTQKRDVFSRMYVQRGDPTSDSKRARIRIGAYLDSLDSRHWFADFLKVEGGIVLGPYNNYEANFAGAGILEILDSVTLIYRFLKGVHDSSSSRFTRPHEELVKFVGKVFAEENLRYSIDRDGYVHPSVDHEFSTGAAAIIRGLARDPAVQKEVDHCYAEMAKLQPSYKRAVRAMFEAIEILTKRMTSAARLDSATIKGELTTIIVTKLGADDTAQRACRKAMISFASWVDGVHFYRHGQKDDEPIDIPEPLAIQMISAGASFLRMLLDAQARLNE